MQWQSLLWDARMDEFELICSTQLSGNTGTQTVTVIVVQGSTDEMQQMGGSVERWKQAFP